VKSQTCWRASPPQRALAFGPIKLNCVVQRGINEGEVLPLVEFARAHGHIIRFIEYMDVGTCNGWRRERVVPSAELRDRIQERWPLRALDAQYRGEVASRYGFADGIGEVGFVSSVSEPFCGDCHRARVSADGDSTHACSRRKGTTCGRSCRWDRMRWRAT
jgi:cyclic pyranopterin phosphate synthase